MLGGDVGCRQLALQTKEHLNQLDPAKNIYVSMNRDGHRDGHSSFYVDCFNCFVKS